MANWVTKEQIESAKNASLKEFFNSFGYTTKMHGGEIYVDEVPGLCINEKTNSWYYHYEGYGGKSPIDCIMKVLNFDFKSAVLELTDVSNYVPRAEEIPSEKINTNKSLKLPEAHENMKRVYAYLVNTRGIPVSTVSELAKQKLIYQDKKGNCVFIHKNKNGEAIGAEIQGTCTDVRYKGVATGTGDSVFKFSVSASKPSKIYAFESAIDMLSFYAIANKEKLKDVMLVSMAGLKPRALQKIAEETGAKVLSCVDNDEAGKRFEVNNNFTRAGTILERNEVKDWNELWQKMIYEKQQGMEVSLKLGSQETSRANQESESESYGKRR